jgi:sec-independent protein translocase protein TatA
VLAFVLGPWEIVIIVAVIVALFGTRKLPEVGRSLGKGIREVKEASTVKEVVSLGAETRKAMTELNPATHVKRAVLPPGEKKKPDGDGA